LFSTNRLGLTPAQTRAKGQMPSGLSLVASLPSP
jgi:hypothetical protein